MIGINFTKPHILNFWESWEDFCFLFTEFFRQFGSVCIFFPLAKISIVVIVSEVWTSLKCMATIKPAVVHDAYHWAITPLDIPDYLVGELNAPLG